MPRRLLVVPQIGEVVVAKRRGSNNIRLSINAAGQVRVGLPYWTPYEAGLLFVKRHQKWIQQQLLANGPRQLKDGSRIGKMHRIRLIKQPAKKGLVEVKITDAEIVVTTELKVATAAVQKKLVKACERALKLEAEQLLPERVELISRQHKLPCNGLKIKKLTSRWGSCSTKKDISLSYFLIQLPWEPVDYVILHELAHTKFHNHSRQFWAYMEERTPNISDIRKQIKIYKPRVEPR